LESTSGGFRHRIQRSARGAEPQERGSVSGGRTPERLSEDDKDAKPALHFPTTTAVGCARGEAAQATARVNREDV
jgi:hypothetical protein